MQKAWRSFKYKLHADFKKMGGDDDPILAKEAGHRDISKADWEYLCDRWSFIQSNACSFLTLINMFFIVKYYCSFYDFSFKEQTRKNAESRSKRKWESRNGSKNTPRHHLSRGLELDGPTGQIETWKIRHCHPTNGWPSAELEAEYVII